MRTNPEEPTLYNHLERYLPVMWLALLFASFLGACYVYRGYFWPIVAAWMIYLVAKPVQIMALRYLGQRHTIAAAVATLFALLCLVLPLFFLVRALIMEAITAVRELYMLLTDEHLLDWALDQAWLTDLLTADDFWWVSLADKLQRFLAEYSAAFELDSLSAVAGQTGTILVGSLSWPLAFAGNFLITMVILIFVFKDGHRFSKFFYEAMPFPDWMERKIVDKIVNDVSAVIKGAATVAFLQGILVGAACALVGLKSPILWGALGGVVSVIPIIGTGIVFFPVTAYLIFIKGETGVGIAYFSFCMAAYQGLDLLVKPKLLDRKLGMHPLLLFGSLLGGLSQFGLVGLILGPLTVSFFLALWDITRTTSREAFAPVAPVAPVPRNPGGSLDGGGANGGGA